MMMTIFMIKMIRWMMLMILKNTSCLSSCLVEAKAGANADAVDDAAVDTIDAAYAAAAVLLVLVRMLMLVMLMMLKNRSSLSSSLALAKAKAASINWMQLLTDLQASSQICWWSWRTWKLMLLVMDLQKGHYGITGAWYCQGGSHNFAKVFRCASIFGPLR